ncbi:MAG: hypothetical protein HZA93_05540 [Verrucomicrobia bacterium]|nr:hypothetical protein [Verrucomicrobiota bacterium]
MQRILMPSLHRPMTCFTRIGLMLARLAGLFCGAYFASAVAVAADGGWIELRTAHYRLVSDAGAPELRKVAMDMERFYAGFEAFWAKAPGKLLPCTIIVFAREADFDAAKPTFRERTSHHGAVFVSGMDAAFIAFPLAAFDSSIPAGRAFFGVTDSRRTEFHESVHYLLSGLARRPPAWFNEGIAELLSTAELHDKGMTVGRVIGPYTVWLSRNGARPIAEIFPVTHDSPEYNDPAKAGSFYGHAWAFLHFLLCGKNPDGPAMLVKFLQLTRDGAHSSEKFRQAFGRDERAFDKQLRDYLDSGRYSTRTVPVFHSASPDALKPAPMSATEVDLCLGQFLLHTKRLPEGRARISRALAALPLDQRARDAAGLLALLEDDAQAAADHFREAIKLGSRQPTALTVTFSARLDSAIQGLAADATLPAAIFDEVANGLKAAINANPIFAEPYRQLAVAFALAPRAEADDAAWLKQGLAIDPDSKAIRASLAMTLARAGHAAEARTLAEAVAPDDLPGALRARFERFKHGL